MTCKWVDDAQRFIKGYFHAIQNCPSEIYHCALTFCPPSSWLHEHYNSKLSGVKVVKGFQTTWGACFRTVPFDGYPQTLAHWKDIVAVGFRLGQIIILDAVTGVQISVLPGHSLCVRALTFSLDGTSLVSGGNDMTIKLWDIQTGGIIRIFLAIDFPISVSISVDNATIAWLYQDRTIGLWDTNPGDTCVTIEYNQANSISFSPTNPRLLLIASGAGTIFQWNIDGPEPMSIPGDDIVNHYCPPTFSPDGTHWILPQGSAATVLDTDSGVVVSRLQVPGSTKNSNWFISPNGKYVACGDSDTILVWDITGPDPHLVNTFVGHTSKITSILFSSSLISSSDDRSIKFWQIDALPKEPAVADGKLPSSTSSPPMTISLQAKDNVAILVDKVGVVRAWDLSTGLCKASFSTPAILPSQGDVQLIGDRVIFVWCTIKKIHIWDAQKSKHHQTIDLISDFSTTSLRISGDGSKVFVLDHEYLQALYIQRGEVIGKIRLGGELSGDPLIVDGSKVWVNFEDSQIQGWDFGILGSTPVPLSDTPPDPDRPHLDFVDGTRSPRAGPSRIVETVTRREIYRLTGRFSMPTIAQWDGRYLVAGYDNGEVLILDFNCMIPQ